MTLFNMKNLLFLLLMASGSLSIIAQNTFVQEVNLEDGPLKEVIVDYIASQKKQASDLGYLEIEQTYYNRNAAGSEIKVHYSIKSQNYMPHLSSSRFPVFYSYLNEEMLLFYFPDLLFQDLGLKNRKILLEKLEPFLGTGERIVGKNEKGEIIIDDPNFRDESYNIHGGILLKIMANGEFLVEKSNPQDSHGKSNLIPVKN